MKMAVTGASGFLGRHVLAELAQHRGIEVTAMTRRPLPPGYAAREVAINLEEPPADCYARLGRPDVLIHLAWAGLPNYRSATHFELQLAQQYRFLKDLVEAGLPSLLCTGTCFEYGLRAGELVETMRPDPRNPYGYAKDALRRQLEFLRAGRPFKLTWTRLFYMFGDGQPATSLYSQLIAAGRRGDTSFAMSHGEQLRDYLPVADIARNIVLLALHAADSGIVNVCSGKPVAVRRLVEGWLAEQQWNIKLDLGRYPYPDYEPLAFWGSAAKLAALLGAHTAP
jgi:nucleoside-diphosphate-sugar epimerase